VRRHGAAINAAEHQGTGQSNTTKARRPHTCHFGLRWSRSSGPAAGSCEFRAFITAETVAKQRVRIRRSHGNSIGTSDG
jgi:hypothetical protein